MLKLIFVLMAALCLTGCSHTFKGVKQDIREDTASNDQHVTVVKKTTVVYPQGQDLPPSPPPLQTPPQ
ncbi:MAG TPA: hypothetical protein VLH77_04205 [Gammaproteobacteria bacterium]|nr:hypothetical protein [Gammaproteobacteria bacterium]